AVYGGNVPRGLRRRDRRHLGSNATKCLVEWHKAGGDRRHALEKRVERRFQADQNTGRRGSWHHAPIMGQMPTALQQTSGTLAACVREEKLLAVDLVIADRFLALGREQPVDKRLAGLHLDVRVFFRV